MSNSFLGQAFLPLLVEDFLEFGSKKDLAGCYLVSVSIAP
jgi:hypothetical protein